MQFVVNEDPAPRVEDVAPGSVRVDAENGFAQVALAEARGLLVEKATDNGIAIVEIRCSGPPVVFDQPSVTVAHGDLQVAARQGRQLPAGTGIDTEGRSAGDPSAILYGGALSTFGGHKGASVALKVEIMCAALVSAPTSRVVRVGQRRRWPTPGSPGSAVSGELEPDASPVHMSVWTNSTGRTSSFSMRLSCGAQAPMD